MKLIDLLLLFLRLGVAQPDPPADTPDDPPADEPAPDPADDLPDVDTDAEPDPKPDETKSPEAEAALAAIRAEKERGDRFERELAEIRGRAPQQRSPADPTPEEERVLKDEKSTDLQKWQVQANVELRRGRTESQLALAQAQDIADQTRFSRIAITKPALFNRYEARVEKTLSEMRSKGYNASREQILKNLIGEDMMEGKFKKAEPKKGDDPKALPRGKLPGARSDVSGKNAMSEHEKRRQRLENVQI